MKEIGKQIYLEDSFDGVVLGAVKLDRGLLLIDSPLRFSDQAAWRDETVTLGEGRDRITLMLDTHIDRVIGMRVEEGNVLGHKLAAEILANRPTSLRSQEVDAGSEAESLDQPPPGHWPKPDMTFSNAMAFYANGSPVKITHRSGCHLAGCWVESESEKILFVGDSVIAHQPPFLALGDLELWLAELTALQSEKFKDYKIVSSRNGLVGSKAIEKLIDFLSYVNEALADLASLGDHREAIADFLPGLLRKLNFDKSLTSLYRKRLAFGLTAMVKRQDAMNNIEE